MQRTFGSELDRMVVPVARDVELVLSLKAYEAGTT